MDSPRSGSLKESVELLRIETDEFDLYIQGKPFHPTVEQLVLHREDDGEWVHATVDIKPIHNRLQIKKQQIFSPKEGRLVDWEGESVWPCFYEHQDYTLILQKKRDEPIAFYHENVHFRQAVKPIGEEQRILTGSLNFRNEVGYTEFEIRIAGETALQVQLEVFPAKINYRSDYENIIRDVNEEIHNLAFDFMRKTYSMAGKRDAQHQSLTEFFSILTSHFGRMVKAVDRIHVAPYHRLQKENRVVEADKVKRLGKENISYLAKRPHLLINTPNHGVIHIQGQRYMPTKAIETRRRIDYDTSENRFLKWVLQKIGVRLKNLRTKLQEWQSKRQNGPNASYQEWVQKIDQMQAQLNRLLRAEFLRDVGEMQRMSITLVLQMAPDYREVHRIYLLLMKGLTLQSDLFRLSLKDVAQLYEYWCFLKLHSLLKKKYNLLKHDILRVNRNGVYVKLDQTRRASVTYENPKNGERFTLFYNSLPSLGRQRGDSVPTLGQAPDNVLSLEKQDSHVKYNYVFDAKYRLNPAMEGTEYHKKYHGLPGPEEEDINTMHRYRDAIVYQNTANDTYERNIFGAFVLFPYQEEEQFEHHHFYKSIKKVNVGALPFLPNSTRLVEAFLDELIMDSPEKAFERSIQQRGTDQYYAEHIGDKNVLIGSLGDNEQLATCLQYQFYHMPLKLLVKDQSKFTQLEWIGLYQSKKRYGEEQCGIRWVGRIRSWSIVQRSEIMERPVKRGNGHELYVRFNIEVWERRIHPIKPGGNSVYSYLLTSSYLLKRAKEIAELRLQTEEKWKEWREKRRRGQVKIELDHENVDQATELLRMEVE